MLVDRLAAGNLVVERGLLEGVLAGLNVGLSREGLLQTAVLPLFKGQVLSVVPRWVAFKGVKLAHLVLRHSQSDAFDFILVVVCPQQCCHTLVFPARSAVAEGANVASDSDWAHTLNDGLEWCAYTSTQLAWTIAPITQHPSICRLLLCLCHFSNI